MTTNADEFDDLMPHRITVRNKLPPNDYGEEGYDDASARTYKCLADDTTSTSRTADGEMITVAATTYVNSTPINSSEPVPIPEDAQVVFTEPVPIHLVGKAPRPLKSVDSHYWADGSLHNQTLRFT